MEPAFYQRFFDIEEHYWWSRWVRDLVRDWLPPGPPTRRILDLGCGTGILSRELARVGRVTAFDYMPDAFPFCRRRGLTQLVRGDGHALPFSDATFAGVMAIDTLEHLRDDGRALAEVRRVLSPEAWLIINVPALQWLWSRHDEVNHHVRRYGRQQLRDAITRAGFAIEKLTFTNCVLFPPVFVARLGERLIGPKEATVNTIPDVSPLVNRTLYSLLGGERRLVRHINLPVGTSLFAVARAI